MSKSKMRLLAGTALAALVLTAVEAQAGGFGIREQSTEGLGVSFAGVAAGGAPSSMYWNPATMTQLPGLSVEADTTAILPNSKITTSSVTAGGVSIAPFLSDPQDNIAQSVAVPSGYVIKQLSPDLWLGLAVNAPYGLASGFQQTWAGRFYGLESSFAAYDFNPSLAYRINNWISIGAGFQAQYATTNLNFGLPAPGLATSDMNLRGNGWGYGFTAGVTLTPWAGTELGVGYRSFINQSIGGTMIIPTLPASTPGSINATLRLPDVVSAGIRQRVNDSFTLLGTVEWTDWSRLGTASVNSAAGGPALVAGVPVTLPFNYQDGWLFSGGFEYTPAPGWALRAGAGYEISPVTDDVRIPVLPDANRIWVSAGVSKSILPGLTLDLSYAHLFVQQGNIAVTAASGNPWYDGTIAYTGTATSSIDILSLGLTLRLPPTPPPAAPLITKG